MLRNLAFAVISLWLISASAYASPFNGMGPPDPVQLRRALDAQHRNHDALVQRPEILGTAVGWRPDGQMVVRVYATRAGLANVPATVDGMPVELEIVGKVYALSNRCKRAGAKGGAGCKKRSPDEQTATVEPEAGPFLNDPYRYAEPIPIGVSTGHPSVTAGTIGCRVIQGCHVFALSNNHVYADEGEAFMLDHALHPGTFDGGSDPSDAIGVLIDYEPIIFGVGGANRIDAAIVEVDPARVGNQTPADGYGIPRADTVSPSIGTKVMKYGRTSGMTYGYIDAVNATINIEYDTGIARFVGQIIIRPGDFSYGGDSGALVVVEDGVDSRRPVGLLFAGSDIIAVANPIDEVLSRLGITIDGE